MTEQKPAEPKRPGGAKAAPRPASHDKLPLLAMLNRGANDARAAAGGFVGAMIVGALALVVALMALTVAIGRAPQEAAAQPRKTPTATAPAAPTSYESPEQTGQRWTAQPIILGVPQKPPSYPPTPTAPKTRSAAPSATFGGETQPPAPAPENPGNGNPAPPGQTQGNG